MVGSDHASSASGKPMAHFSVGLGSWSGVRPACAAGWKCVFVTEGLQPFHDGLVAGFTNGAGDPHIPDIVPVMATLPIFLPVRYSATARRSAPLSFTPW